MLRSPTHSPTIPLTQSPLQFNGDRSTGAQIHRKLYHDHYHQTQQYKQQRKKDQQQQQQQQQYLISKTAEKKLLPPVRVVTTETKTSDNSSSGDSMREVAAVATTLATNFNLNKNKATAASSLTNVTNSCCSSNSQLSKTATSSSSLILSPLLTTTTTTTSTAITLHSMSPTSQTPSRTSLFDSCHRKIRLIGGGPVAFLGGLVAKARRKERDGDQNSTDTKLYLEESVLERKLPEADLKALVDLPAGLDYNEWLASHTLALFEHVNLVYGTVSEFCTPSGCPDMTGPGNRTYLWFDEKGKKTRVASPQYIDYVMTFTQKTVSDESIFPTKYANEFPSSFESIARKILRLQFHVIAHLYAAHFREIALLGLHTHLNLTFAHLTALHRRFNLIDEKETDVLRDLEVALRLTDDSHHHNNSSSNNQHQGSNSDSGTYDTGTNYQPAYAAGHGGNSHHHYVGTGGSANSSSSATAADDSNVSHATAIDGDASSQPICTQPEAKTGGTGGGGASNVFGGGGGLMGGILGDFTGSEFSDTSRYCTSAVPSSSANNTNGAGALQLNFNNNYNAHAHQHHLQHHHHQQHQHQHNIVQCNSTTTPSPHNTTTA